MEQSTEEKLKEIAEKTDLNYSLLKVAEECTEVSELCIKKLTKISDLQPTDENIVEECADLLSRISILVLKMGKIEKLIKLSHNKTTKIHEDVLNNKNTKIEIIRN